MKRCPHCKETKPAEAFYPCPTTTDRLSSYCKACKAAIRRRKAEAFNYDFTPAELERFWRNVAAPDANGCMVWTNYKNDYGYGQFAVQNRQLGAHRIAWKLAGNELPIWPNVIDHTCRNRPCCNVAHMRAVPQRVNTTENSDSVYALNAAKEFCKDGHPFAGANLAIGPSRYFKVPGRVATTRICLTCQPNMWMYAVIERKPSPRARVQWRGPFKPEMS